MTEKLIGIAGSKNLAVLLSLAISGALIFDVIRFNTALPWLKSLLFFIFFMLLPGYLLFVTLSNKDKTSKLTILFLSSLLGIGYNIVFFALFTWLDANFFFILLTGFVDAISIYFLSTRWDFKDFEVRLNWVLVNLFLLTLLVHGINWILSYNLIRPGVELSYYVDIPWHIGNIAELKNHFPPHDIRIAEIQFKYHYFVYVWLASLSKILRVNTSFTLLRFFPFFYVTALFSGIYCLSKNFFKKYRYKILVLVIFFFVGSLDGISLWFQQFLNINLGSVFNYYTKFLFLSPTYTLALIIFIGYLVVITRSLKKDNFDYLLLFYLIFIGIGSKGSFLPVVGSGILLSFLFHRKKRKEWFILGITSLAMYLPMYYFVYYSQIRGTMGRLSLEPFSVVYATNLSSLLRSIRVSLGVTDNLVFTGLALLVFIPFWYFLFFGVKGIGLYDSLKDVKTLSPELKHQLYIFLGSITFTLLLGRHQLYFVMFSMLPLTILTVKSTNFDFPRWNGKHIVLMLFLVLGVVTIFTYSIEPMVELYLNKGRVTIEAEQVNGYLKIKKETDPDDIVWNPRHYIYYKADKSSRYFFGTAISERRNVLEGWQFSVFGKADSETNSKKIDKILTAEETLLNSKNEEEIREICSNFEADYLLVPHKKSTNLNFLKRNFPVVFSMENITL
ncbi:MAG: hypothetical protein ACLFT6_06135, partial [Bacteroidales bacterium]